VGGCLIENATGVTHAGKAENEETDQVEHTAGTNRSYQTAISGSKPRE
jgi:hypothetical protein